VPRFTYDTPVPKISKCQLCQHRAAEGKYAACAEVCPTGATLFGKVKDLKAEVARRRALTPGTPTTYPRGKIGGGDTYQGTAGQLRRAHLRRARDRRHPGAAPVGGAVRPAQQAAAARPLAGRASETIQHGIYYGLLAPIGFLGLLVAAARRNMISRGVQPVDAPPGPGSGGQP
jgi:hypothetical protein